METACQRIVLSVDRVLVGRKTVVVNTTEWTTIISGGGRIFSVSYWGIISFYASDTNVLNQIIYKSSDFDTYLTLKVEGNNVMAKAKNSELIAVYVIRYD